MKRTLPALIDLRTAIAEAINDSDISGHLGSDPYFQNADAVLAVLGDPVRRLAILNLIGEVTEGWTNPVTESDVDNFVVFRQPWNKRTPCIVVRPRGEATDA